jgi:hypothetical protein
MPPGWQIAHYNALLVILRAASRALAIRIIVMGANGVET